VTALAAAQPDPQNLEAEETVIGGMLLSPLAVDAAEEVLGPVGDAFYRDSHRVMYRAILALHAQGEPADAVSVSAFLDRHGKLADAGGKKRIHELGAIVPAWGNVAHYAGIVVEQSRRRELLTASAEIAKLARDEPDPDAALAQAEQRFIEMRDRFDGKKTTVRTSFEAAEYLEWRRNNPMKVEDGIPSPYSFLPMLLPGRLYVLSGYQADGKTALTADFIKAAAAADKRTGFHSIEMRFEDVAVRLGANAGAPAKQIETGHIREQDQDVVRAAIAKVAMLNCHIIDDPMASVASISRHQRILRHDLVIVDHLHQFLSLMEADPKHERQAIEKIVRGMVLLARTEQVPVILLSQLSRASDNRKPFPRPNMAMLRGSAVIEQLAWCIWFIWRQRDDKNLPLPQAEWITAKNRSGKPGAWDMFFHDQQVRYSEGAHV
jgi:replicative DNA helicase